jgi:hypothetical protein
LNALKVISKSLLVFLCLTFLLSGCSNPKILRFQAVSGGSLCEVEVEGRGASGVCVGKNGTKTGFDLWSQSVDNFSIIAQGLNSEDRAVTTGYGLRINGVEQGPSDGHWKRLLKDTRLLCNQVCGAADWRVLE